MRRRMTPTVAISLVLLSACGADVQTISQSGEPSSGDSAVVSAPNKPGDYDPATGVQGYVPGKPLLVGSMKDQSLVGWIDGKDVNLPIGHDNWALIPVHDEQGHQIAWWGTGIGWFDLDEVAAPGFDYHKLYLEAIDSRLKGQTNSPKSG